MNQFSKSKRVALIVPGGIGTGKNNLGVPVLEQIVKRLSLDFDITIFQLFPVNPDYVAPGFKLIPVHSSNPFVRMIKFFLSFRRLHTENKFEVIHGFWAMPCGFFAVLMGKLYGIKSLVSLLGGDAVSLPQIKYGQLQNPVYKQIILWSLRKADEVIALTQFLANNIRNAGCKRTDIRIIPWGIDIEVFTFSKKEFKRPVQFLHVANLHPVKDQSTLLHAFGLINSKLDSHLTIIGEGVDNEKVNLLITNLGLGSRVSILKPVANHEMPKFYHQCDVLLHTSISEGQSEVVTEAICCGVLVCGTKVGLMHDLPSCCVAVPVGEYELLAEEVLKVISDQNRRVQIVYSAHQWVMNHSIGWTVNELSNLYGFTAKER
jgi:glycosyltransferase involved in cell wall biosynthesis